MAGNSKTKKGFPDYDNPPVIEVVCGVLFRPMGKFLTPHVGLLWEKYRDEYPECSEVAPLDPVIERFEEPPQISLEIANVPPLPRVWFVHKEGRGIIQVQRDRFLHNWRKTKPEDLYPRYHTVKEMYKDRFLKFRDFLEENELGTMEPLQYEMTYVNHIPQGQGWQTFGDIASLFPDFSFDAKKSRFLPEPNTLNWRTTFILPENAARMHVVIRNVKMRESGQPMILLELTVRGIGQDKTLEGMFSWFDLAREWIVCGFADITAERVQREIWKRKR